VAKSQKMRHRKVRSQQRRMQPRRAMQAAGMATGMAASAMVMLLTARQASASPNPSDVQSAIDQVLGAQQQIANTDAADFPTASSPEQALLGPYTQDTALQMLYFQLNQQNLTQTNPLNPYLPTDPYPSNAPLADPQAVLASNPDNIYNFTPIVPTETYTVTVQPGPGTEDLNFSPETGFSLSNTNYGTGLPGAVDLSNATPNADGTYTIVWSPTDPAGTPTGNWVDTAGAEQVWIRDTLGNFGAEPDQVTIQATSALGSSPYTLPALSDNDISSMLSAIATDMPANNASNFPFWGIFDSKLPANTFLPIMGSSSLGVGGTLQGQLDSYGNFTVEPGQAEIVEVPNIDAAYTGFETVNGWGETLPYATVEGSLNNTQLFADPDGSTYYVLSPTDPGVANWIDTSGVTEGGVLLRWQNATEAAPSTHIVTETVPIADVSQYLPADTPTVTPAEYATILQDRLLDYNYEQDATSNMVGWVTQNLEIEELQTAMGTTQYDEVFGGPQVVPSILDRLTDPSLSPDPLTVGQDLLANPGGSLTALVDNLPLAAQDIDMPVVLAIVSTDEVIGQTAQAVTSDISSGDWSQALTDLDTGVQDLGTAFTDASTDPTTSISAGVLNAFDDLGVSIMNADSYSALSASDFTSVLDQLSSLDQSASELLSAGFGLLAP
jgi:Protein of unknown function (DUF1214)